MPTEAAMELILILAGAIAGVGAFLYVSHRLHGDDKTEDTPAQPDAATADAAAEEGCCGMHISCERDSLLAAVSPEVEYYDDEELDRFRGRNAESYTESETEEFRDILLTLLPDDIAGWARSLQLRSIELPADVRDELLLIVGEERARRYGK